MRLRFRAKSVVLSPFRQLPSSTLDHVEISCHDQCTSVGHDLKNGECEVDYNLEPVGEARDTLKFHFTLDRDHVASGWVGMEDFLSMGAGGVRFEIGHNLVKNHVMTQIGRAHV